VSESEAKKKQGKTFFVSSQENYCSPHLPLMNPNFVGSRTKEGRLNGQTLYRHTNGS
jgi:hypothetical protein